VRQFPIAALFAAGWIGYRSRRLTAIESCLVSLESQIAALQSIAVQQLWADAGRTCTTVETEKCKVQPAEWEIAAARSSANRDFRGYTTELALTPPANGTGLDAFTEEVLLRSFIDQFGRSGSN